MPRLFWIALLFVSPATLPAGEKAAAKLRSPIGTLLERDRAKGWLAPVLYDAIPADAQLVALPGARGILEIREGDVRFVLAGGLPDASGARVLESAVTFKQPAAGYDLEFVLDRGRVVIENHKENGAVKVRAHIKDKSLDFDLLSNKTVVALELSSHWPAGAPFTKKPKADHRPVGELVFLIATGKAEIELNKAKQTLQGPILYQFNTLGDVQGPLALKKTAEWVSPAENQPDMVKKQQTAVEKLRRAIAEQGALPAITSARKSSDLTLRGLAAYSGTALDDPAAGIAALTDAKSKDVRAAGMRALQHYIGRGSAEDVRLYDALITDRTKPGQASIIMELLHGIRAEARQRPETYDALISYLQSDQIGIRELAAANLYRLVPQGQNIAFDAAGTADQRARAQASWRKLIPEGQVPKTVP